eukprot:jgi/Bigna1/133430/aug1.21_g8138
MSAAAPHRMSSRSHPRGMVKEGYRPKSFPSIPPPRYRNAAADSKSSSSSSSSSDSIKDEEDGATCLAGFVSRITFSTEKDEFKVIKVRMVGGGKRRSQQVTVVGQLPGVTVGQTLDLRGHWGTHPRHGKRFAVTSWEERAPDSEADMVVYLQGMIKGVGPVTARNIVKKLGDGTLQILDGEDAVARLREVKGVGAKTAAVIKENWDRGRDSREALQFLQRVGMSVRVAQRVVMRFGQNTERIVRQDPYTALSEVRGGGFTESERIAQMLQSSPELPSRFMAAVSYALSSASNNEGHTYLPLPRLIESTVRLLQKQTPLPAANGGGLDPKSLEGRVTQAVQCLHSNGHLMLRRAGASHVLHPREHHIDELFQQSGREDSYSIRCQSKELAEAELSVKADLLSRALQPHIEIDETRLDSWLERYQAQTTLKLNHEQLQGVRRIASASISILTGGPGCGKTVTAQALVALWSAMGKKIKLCAPTGRAAQRLSEVAHAEAQTIHRLLEFEQKAEGSAAADDLLEVGEANGRFTRNRQNPIDADVVLLDECSMLDLPLASALLEAIPSTAQVVLIGDADQLPPVGPGAVFADAIKSQIFPQIKLHHVFRQQQANDSNIVASAHMVNEGVVPQLERIDGRRLLKESKMIQQQEQRRGEEGDQEENEGFGDSEEEAANTQKSAVSNDVKNNDIEEGDGEVDRDRMM